MQGLIRGLERAGEHVPTGVAPLDRLLGGGFRRGVMAMISGDTYSDVQAIVRQMLSTSERAGEEPLVIVRSREGVDPYRQEDQPGDHWRTDQTYPVKRLLPFPLELIKARANMLLVLDLGWMWDSLDADTYGMINELQLVAHRTNALCVVIGDDPPDEPSEVLEAFFYHSAQYVVLSRGDDEAPVARLAKDATRALPDVREARLDGLESAH